MSTCKKKTVSIHRSAVCSIVMLAHEGCEILDIVGPLDVFAVANFILKESGKVPLYGLQILAEKRGACPTSSGLRIVADRSWREWKGRIDTLMIAGGPHYSRLLANQPMLKWIRRQAGTVRRLASICSGAFALAEVGLLKGRRAATHWLVASELASAYPDVDVVFDAIYVKDGAIYSSAGVTAGMDLTLALVEEDLGRQVALKVAKTLVLYLKRPGGQSQYSSQLRAQVNESPRLSSLVSWLSENYCERLTVEMMADRAVMSPRNFARVFVSEMGATPARYVEQLRLELAIQLLEGSDQSMDSIAGRSGFANIEQFRRTFFRRFRITPIEYRERFRSARRKG